jgi:hypothetical protein
MQVRVAEVLAAWREAERVAAEQPPGSPDHLAGLEAIEGLRALYAELTASASTDRAPDDAAATVNLSNMLPSEGG